MKLNPALDKISGMVYYVVTEVKEKGNKMTAIIILSWLYVCAMSFSIMMIRDYCSKDELAWCIPWFILGPIWVIVGWFVVRPLMRKARKRKGYTRRF